MGRVKIYRNLHKDLWSVMDSSTRRIVGRLESLSLSNCSPVVSEAGRQRVMRERAKNVHAFLCGELCEARGGDFREISYNPYKCAHFYFVDTGDEFKGASYVEFTSSGKVMALIE